MFLFLDQFLRSIEQCLELLEVGVHGGEHVFMVIQTETSSVPLT